MDEEKKNKVMDMFKANSRPKTTRRKPGAERPGNVIYVNGDGVAVGQIAGGDIHNHVYEAPPRRPAIKVIPGAGTISEEQKRELMDLREQWIELHGNIRRVPLTPASAWSKINRAGKATSYHLISPENFPRAVAFIKREMAMLRNMRSAPTKDPKWRNSRIKAIKARCANQLEDERYYAEYINKNFRAASLSELSDDELQRTYTYVLGVKLIRI